MLKKSFSFVLTSLKGSTYGLGKHLFRQVKGERVKTVRPRPFAHCGFGASVKFHFVHVMRTKSSS